MAGLEDRLLVWSLEQGFRYRLSLVGLSDLRAAREWAGSGPPFTDQKRRFGPGRDKGQCRPRESRVVWAPQRHQAVSAFAWGSISPLLFYAEMGSEGPGDGPV